MKVTRPRDLRMEQFEARVLLSISPTLADQAQAEWNTRLGTEISRAANLQQYATQTLASTTQWVVGVSATTAASSLASKLGATIVQNEPLLPRAAIWQFPVGGSHTSPATLLASAAGVDFYYPLIAAQQGKRMVPNDPLFTNQWHLHNTGQEGGTPGADADIETAWDTATGSGVVIGIVDDGLQYTHPDLQSQYNASLSHDFDYNDADPSPDVTADYHGTAVAGVAAAATNNGVGVAGAAPGAQLAGLRLIAANTTDTMEATALDYLHNDIDIYSNSWGPPDAYDWLDAPGPLTLAALHDGVTNGRSGLGNIYVWAGGNGLQGNDNSNYDGYANSRYVVAVGAIDNDGKQSYYSESGANLLVAAYSSGDTAGITTTDLTGTNGYDATNYTNEFGGTSSATPLVSGVVALMLQANPNLTWRDVRYILAQSAKKTDAADADWTTNAAGYHINHKYGFGAIDAAAAVALAKTWVNVLPEVSSNSATITVNKAIPDNNTTGVSSTTTLPSGLGSVEEVEVTFTATHAYSGDLEVVLTSPSGTQSVLAEKHSDGTPYTNWVFTTTRCLGETSEGQWTLTVRDLKTGNTGTWNSWKLTAYGPVNVAAGPHLVSIIPNAGQVLNDGEVLYVAPQELLFRFSEGQSIDPATLSAIHIVRAGGDRVFGNANDVTIDVGYIGIGDQPNEVIVRFKDALPDDLYQITIDGTGPDALLNLLGIPFNGGKDLTIGFELDLGAQVTAVVPQPVTRDAAGHLVQARNQIEVYFNHDELDAAAATNPQFYQLIATQDTADPTDDPAAFHPTSVTYDVTKDKVVLTFASDLDSLVTDATKKKNGAFRLRIGDQYRPVLTTTVSMIDPKSNTSIDAGNNFYGAKDLSTLGVSLGGGAWADQSEMVTGEAISPSTWDQIYAIELPGADDNPGHRDLPDYSTVTAEDHILAGAASQDADAGIKSIAYNFSGTWNLITENQKQRTREIFALYSHYLGVNFYETTDQGIQVATGDLAYAGGASAPGGVAGLGGGNLALMDYAEDWGNSEFGGAWFEVAMHEIGHCLSYGHAYDLPEGTIMGGGENGISGTTTAEPVFPGDNDIVHGQYMYRPDSNDIDLYKFEVEQRGKFSAETFAQRRDISSLLNTSLTLYKEQQVVEDGQTVTRWTPVSNNDDYYGKDSYLEMYLEPGTYYIGVTASQDDQTDPGIDNTGTGGVTQGPYDLRLNFEPNGVNPDDPTTFIGSNTTELVDKRRNVLLDGDADGVPGGTYNYWFNVQNDTRVTGQPTTLFVDKLSTATRPDGTLANPYKTIPQAFAAAKAGDIVRIEGNNFANDSAATPSTLLDNVAYEIGTTKLGASLSDGTKMEIPQGVTVMIDAGSLFKLRGANIDVGSSAEQLDRSGGSLQVLGIPGRPVTFTSHFDETQGVDTEPSNATSPKQGDWGGLVFRNDHDYDFIADYDPASGKAARKVLETQGIFLDYVNHADLRFGGGKVIVNGVESVYTPVHMVEARPTVSFNTITNSADAAISGDPNSFADTKFENWDMIKPFTLDYDRVGPDVHGNVFVASYATAKNAAAVTNTNTINGMFVRIRTQDGKPIDQLDVPARFDDGDVVHVISENLMIRGDAGGPTVVPNTCPLIIADVSHIVAVDAETVDPLTGLSVHQIKDGDYFSLFDGATKVTFEFDLWSKATGENIGLGVTTGHVAVNYFGADPDFPDDPTAYAGDTAALVAQAVANAINQARATQGLNIYATANGDVVTLENHGTTLDTIGFNTVETLAGAASGAGFGKAEARLAGRLNVDPGLIVKLNGANIETGIGAQFIAEGRPGSADGAPGSNVVFTALVDDRYGAGGTFITSDDGANGTPAPATWGGLSFGPLSSASIDRAVIAFGGGQTTIEGGLATFDPVEIRQAHARVTNTRFEYNMSGSAGDRNGRGFIGPGTIYVRGSQPILVNNDFYHNDGPAVNIDANSLNAAVNPDWGRSTGYLDAFTAYAANVGPMVRENRMTGKSTDASDPLDTVGTNRLNTVNGMVVRGATLTTESVWDDTDIVHVLYDEISVPNFHTYGGLRLQSSADQSLVVKLMGDTAGFTATGAPQEIDDRVGGTVQLVGTPGHPVVLTSLADDTVGAGFNLRNQPQFDTNNDGAKTSPAAGDWRSVKLDEFSNDRNVAVINEAEKDYYQTDSASTVSAEDTNAVPGTAQVLGRLAESNKGGDEKLRLGFEVHGHIRSDDAADVDVYSFDARPGAEVWIDIDRTTYALDTVIELIDADGNVLAYSDNSLDEQRTVEALAGDENSVNTQTIPDQGLARTMNRDAFQRSGGELADQYTTNPRDAGLRVVLPGVTNDPTVVRTYYVRVYSGLGIGDIDGEHVPLILTDLDAATVPDIAALDGETFQVSDANGHPTTFEFVDAASGRTAATLGNTAIFYDSAAPGANIDTLRAAVVQAINGAMTITGVDALTVPDLSVLDATTFQISAAGGTPVTFEFVDQNVDSVAAAGHTAVLYDSAAVGTTIDTVRTAMIAAINAAGLNVTAVALPDGTVTLYGTNVVLSTGSTPFTAVQTGLSFAQAEPQANGDIAIYGDGIALNTGTTPFAQTFGATLDTKVFQITQGEIDMTGIDSNVVSGVATLDGLTFSITDRVYTTATFEFVDIQNRSAPAAGHTAIFFNSLRDSIDTVRAAMVTAINKVDFGCKAELISIGGIALYGVNIVLDTGTTPFVQTGLPTGAAFEFVDQATGRTAAGTGNTPIFYNSTTAGTNIESIRAAMIAAIQAAGFSARALPDGSLALYGSKLVLGTDTSPFAKLGRTTGTYQLQVRLQETQEIPGSTVRYSDIRYATNGIEIIGLPYHSPLLTETADVEIKESGGAQTATSGANDTRATAQEIGDLVASDRDSLGVAGYLSGSNDVDWYKFEVNYTGTQNIPGVTNTSDIWSTIFDIDYADNMGRPDLTLWVFDSSGKLVLASRSSNIADDQPGPTGTPNLDDLSRGSVGGGDPYIGSAYLPTGTYYVAVTQAGASLSATTDVLARYEPIDSVNRIVEEHIDAGSDASNLSVVEGGSRLTLTPNAFNLGDVVTYVNTTDDLYTVDAYTGSFGVDVTDYGANWLPDTHGAPNLSYYDIAMRNDGRLYTLTGKGTGNVNQNNIAGQYRWLDTHDAKNISSNQSDGIITYEIDPTSPTTNQTLRTVNNGVEFNAMTMGLNNDDRYVLAVGNAGAGNGVKYTRNLMYVLDSTGKAVQYPGAAVESRITSNYIPYGMLLSAPTLLAMPATDTTVAYGDNRAPVLAKPLGTPDDDIDDGVYFTLTDNNGMIVTFEMDCGAEMLTSTNGAADLRDGDTFTLQDIYGATATFEFDSGPVLVVPNGKNINDGDVITLKGLNANNQAVTKVLEFDSDGKTTAGNAVIQFKDTDSADTIAAAVLTAINGLTGITTKATLNGTRVTLQNETGVAVGTAGALPGVAVDGAKGVAAGHTAITFEETYTADLVGYYAVNAVETQLPAVDAGFAHRTGDVGNFGDRFTFYNATVTNVSLVTPALQGLNVVASSVPGVTAGRYAVPFTAADDAQTIATNIETAIDQAAKVTGAVFTASSDAGTVSIDGLKAYNAANALPLSIKGSGPGGNITGLAYLNGQLYAVSDKGGFYQVTNANTANLDQLTNGNHPENRWGFRPVDPPQGVPGVKDIALTGNGPALVPITTVTYNGAAITFSGLTAGPTNVENGIYANNLFATDSSGRLYALDATGTLQPAFIDGADSVQLTTVDGANLTGVTGIAFSVIDYNLWHQTIHRGTDEGHGVNTSYDYTRNVPVQGATSYYFGLEDPRTGQGDNQPGAANFSDNSNAGNTVYDTYDMCGGAHGSLTTSEFSLKGYSASDSPMLYFNYFADTQNSADYDSLRVYVSTDGAHWSMLATNTDRNSVLFGMQDFSGVDIVDTGDSWRQARISLGGYAGQEHLRLRFDMSTASEMHIGDPQAATPLGPYAGFYLASIPANQLRDILDITNAAVGFIIDGIAFQFDTGYALVAPNGAGAAIKDGEWFDVTSGATTVRFEFDKNGAVTAGNTAIDLSDNPSGITVAARISAAINASPLAGLVTPVLDDRRVWLTGAATVAQSVSPKVFLQGNAPGVVDAGNIPIPVTGEMTREDVAQQISTVVNAQFGATAAYPEPELKLDPDLGYLSVEVGHLVTDLLGMPYTGPLGYWDTDLGAGVLAGDHPADKIYGTGVRPNDRYHLLANSQNNTHEGWYVDDIIIGCAERGEMVTGVDAGTTFNLGSSGVSTGSYRLEIRRGVEYGTYTNGPPTTTIWDQTVDPTVETTWGFNTNDRLTDGYSVKIPTASEIKNGSTFTISDGSTLVTIMFIDSKVGGGAGQGIPVYMTAGDDGAALAAKVVTAINKNTKGLKVSAVVTATSDRVDLFGATSVMDVDSGVIPVLYDGLSQTSMLQAIPASIILPGSMFSVDDASVVTKFQFVLTGVTVADPGAVPIDYTGTEDALTMAALIEAAINGAGLNATALQLWDIDPTTGMQIPNTRVLVYGAVALVDIDCGISFDGVTQKTILQALPGNETRHGSTFTINDGIEAVTFQLLDNAVILAGAADGVDPNAVPVYYNVDDTADVIAAAIAEAIMANDRKLKVTAIQLLGEPNKVQVNGATAVSDVNAGIQPIAQTNTHSRPYGDDNKDRDQGQVIIDSNSVTHSKEYGIVVAPADRYSNAKWASPGSPATLGTVNSLAQTAGVVIQNNLLAYGGTGGIHFSGDKDAAGTPLAAVPFGRIVNNTIFGSFADETPTPEPGGTAFNFPAGAVSLKSYSQDGNALRNALLGTGIAAVGNATFVGSSTSAGMWTDGTNTGIILTSGDAKNCEPPNNSDSSDGQASLQADSDLDKLFGVKTDDTTSLTFQFISKGGDLYFNYVFASEEYNEFVNSDFNDVFAFFLDGKNIALVPGTTTPVAINNVNNGNPLGTGATNPGYYHNNDPSDGGGFLNLVGYDGFTTTFTATALGLTPGTHTIKLAVSDVTDTAYDTAVFIQAGSFSDQPTGGGKGAGILVDNNAAPTVVNNIVANVVNGIIVDATSTSTVVANTVYQNATTPLQGAAMDSFSRVLAATDPLFVDPVRGNFYLAENSKAIDSSINAVQDRPNMVAVKTDVGLAQSPVLAPDLDLYGQLRMDDASVPNTPGLGSNVFKDRGAVDRVDFLGPTATLTYPLDANKDGDVTVVNQTLDQFVIQLSDPNGTGIDDNFVTSSRVQIYKDGATDPLVDNVDYFFIYNATNDAISLIPAAGIWSPNSTYKIVLNDNIDGIRDLAGNVLQANRLDGTCYFTITLPGVDFGDAPDPHYPTLLGNDGARHIVNPDIHLGALINSETDARQNSTATADTSDDGVTLSGKPIDDAALLIGGTTQITVTAALPATIKSGKLDVWIDFNDDGDWTDPGEEVFVDQTLVNGANVLNLAIPAGLTRRDTFARFRFSTIGGLDPTGEAPDGEVEDYQLHLIEYYQDFGDAPDATYPTLLANDGARHNYDPTVDVRLGSKIDFELEGQPSADAKGDDYNQGFLPAGGTAANDEDGVSFDYAVVPGQQADVTITATVPAGVTGAVLNAWFDFNADGDWSDAGEQIFTNQAIVDGANHLNFSVPGTAVINTLTFARFRLGTQQNLSYTGAAANGEVEDYGVKVVAAPEDFGDAPDGPYHTLLASGGARHSVLRNFSLGPTITYETDGQPNATATGDSDDGVTVPATVVEGQAATITVSTNNTSSNLAQGYLNAWVDFNGDGDWTDPGEQIATNLALANNAATPLTFTVPSGLLTISKTTFARFRYSHTTGLGPDGPAAGLTAPDGEVEDYALQIVVGDSSISGFKYNDRNGNGTRDGNELGMAGVTIYLDANNNGAPDAGEKSMVTDATGYYTFTKLFSGDYVVREVAPDGWVQTGPSQNNVALGNGVVSHYVSPNGWYTVTLPPTTPVANLNFGNYLPAHVAITGAAISEGNYGLTNLNLTLHLTQSFGAPVTVSYATADGDGHNGAAATAANNDYKPTSGSVTIPGLAVDPNPTWTTQVLTNTSHNHYDYHVSGSRIVWEDFDANGQGEIYLYDSGTITQLTDNAVDDKLASIYGNNVVWSHFDGKYYQIYLYQIDKSAGPDNPKQLTNTTFDNLDAQVSDSAVVWWSNYPGNSEIYYYDIAAGAANAAYQPVNISSTATSDHDSSDIGPQISGAKAVWSGYENGQWNVYCYDGTTKTKIATTSTANHEVQIDGNNIVWRGSDGTNQQIYLNRLDGNPTIQVSSATGDNFSPQISGDNIVWQGFNGTSKEIYLCNMTSKTVVDISNSTATDVAPRISGNRVVWHSLFDTDWEVMYYQIGGTTGPMNLSNNSVYDYYPQVSDSLVVWRTAVGSFYQVAVATYNPPEVTVNVSIPIVGDTSVEPDESFYVNITGTNIGAVLGAAVVDGPQAVATILNDDGGTYGLDYGDAPGTSYPTLLASNGARHVIDPAFHLGALIDAEGNGQPNVTATGDNTATSNDEDGVSLPSTVTAGQTVSLVVTAVGVTATRRGYLDAWIDYNGDGDWDDLGEQVFVSKPLASGANTLSLTVPYDAKAGTTYARFRYSSAGGLKPTGNAMDGEVEDYAVTVQPSASASTLKRVTLLGTSGDDRFKFFAGSTYRVVINGVVTLYDPATVSEIVFNGAGGNDTAILTGDTADEFAELRPDGSAIYRHGALSVIVRNAEVLTVTGGGGRDAVLLRDSTGDDSLTVYPTLATMTGTGINYTANNFTEVYAPATVGNDQVKLYDSAAAEELYSTPTYSTMSSTALYYRADAYDTVLAYGAAGGADVAKMYDSSGDDLFYATPDYAILSGAGFYNRAKRFKATYGYASAGIDTAKLIDSPGDDVFTAYPTFAKMVGPASLYYNRAEMFDYVYAYGTGGGKNTAYLYGAAGTKDTFTATQTDAILAGTTPSGTGYLNRAKQFQEVYAYANAGDQDTAALYDSALADSLVADKNWAYLMNSGLNFKNLVQDFKSVTADGSKGGGNTKTVAATVDWLIATGQWS